MQCDMIVFRRRCVGRARSHDAESGSLAPL